MSWIEYKGRTQLPGIPDGHVTLSPRGSMGFAADLAKPEMKNHYCRIAYDPDTQRLRLTLLPQPTSTTYCFREDNCHFRLEPGGAMKQWKLFPSEPLLCSARWVDGSLIVQLPGGQPPKPIPPRPETPEDKPERKQRAANWVGRITCPECGNLVPYRDVQGKRVLRSHRGPAGEPCNRRVVDVPFDSAETKTPQCICDECGGCVPLVRGAEGSYPYSHRVAGHICKGIFREPARILE